MFTIFWKEYLIGFFAFYVIAVLVGRFFALAAWRGIHNHGYSSKLLNAGVFNRSIFSRSGPVKTGVGNSGFGWLVIILCLVCIAIFIPMEMAHT